MHWPDVVLGVCHVHWMPGDDIKMNEQTQEDLLWLEICQATQHRSRKLKKRIDEFVSEGCADELVLQKMRRLPKHEATYQRVCTLWHNHHQ